ncbi:unnamed protein product [Dicrocoelium dendriticum]|nr:unnamed protein product [Dicrocoelium dendriticum]
MEVALNVEKAGIGSAVNSISVARRLYESHLLDASRICTQNNAFNFLGLLDSTWHSQPCMLGIDEAGRGPVLGPMVYACVLCPLAKSDSLKTLGFADSKVLSEQQRERLLTEVVLKNEWISGAVRVISPVFISDKMLDRYKTNLNTISHDSAIELIQTVLANGIHLTEVFVDTVGKAEHYQAKLQVLFPTLKVCVETKADDTYPIVSAASVLAKVTRDRLLRMWPKEERGPVADDLPIGSGYPGDPLTKKYLEMCVDPIFGFPSLVRSSWSTAANLLTKHGIAVSWEDDEDEEHSAPTKRPAKKLATGSGKLSEYFTPTPLAHRRYAVRRAYFVRSSMTHVDSLC